jgi:aryl-alcohol dehydrogenase-like predicted oxidoreductase
MDRRNIGRSGLRVSEVGLGCNNFGWRIGLDEARAVVHKALDLGVTLFDTADIYGNGGGSEDCLGHILSDRRKEIVLSTKFGMSMGPERRGASRRYIIESVEGSLRRLRTDWIDLYQLHEPDPLTPIEETLRALDDLIRQGKVRYIGCSNLSAWEIVRARHISKEMELEHFISTQDEYSLIIRDAERELIPSLQAYGMGFLPYFPLASGLLTGKYRRGEALPTDSRFATIDRLAKRYLNDANWRKTEALAAFCEQRGRDLVELAFSWLLAQPAVSSVMAGATRPDQVEANVRAAQWKLSAEDLQDIDEVDRGEVD